MSTGVWGPWVYQRVLVERAGLHPPEISASQLKLVPPPETAETRASMLRDWRLKVLRVQEANSLCLSH
jgi:hypothetical protein